MAPGGTVPSSSWETAALPQGSEAFRPLGVSLSGPLVVKETWKLDRTIVLRH